MADPLVVRVLADYRQRLQDAESAQFADLARRWMAVQDRLEVAVDALAEELYALRQAGEVVSRGRLLLMARYRSLLAQLEAETARFERGAAGAIERGQVDYGGLGLEAAAEAVDAAYVQAGRIPVDWNRLQRPAIEAIAGLASDGSPLTALLAQSYPLAVQTLTDTLVQAVGLGWGPRRTAAAMRQAADLPLNRALRIARTEQLRAYREAARLQYQESGVVLAYRRLASKSTRTCTACLFADGRRYELDEPLDEHVNGRCQLVPIVDGVPERRWQTGRAWFEALPPGQQEQILGPQAFALWRDRGFDLEAFVAVREDAVWGNSLQVTPAGELKKLVGGARPPAPIAAAAEEALGEFSTLQSAAAWAAQQYPHVAWDFAGAHVDTINPTLRQWDRLAHDYPDVAQSIRYVGTMPGNRYWVRHPNTWAFATRDGTTIALNPAYYGNPERFRQTLLGAVEIGWHPPGCDNFESVITHEFGHHVHNWLLTQSNVAFSPVVLADGTGLVDETTRAFMGKLRRLPKISAYARENEYETWAENFAALYHTDQAEWVAVTRRLEDYLAFVAEADWLEGAEWRFLSDLPDAVRAQQRAELLARLKKFGFRDG